MGTRKIAWAAREQHTMQSTARHPQEPCKTRRFEMEGRAMVGLLKSLLRGGVLLLVLLAFHVPTAQAQTPDFTDCHTDENGADGSVWCASMEEAQTAARNAAYDLNTHWFEVGSLNTLSREPVCSQSIRYGAYGLVDCIYRGMFSNRDVWRKYPLASCTPAGNEDPESGRCGIPKCDGNCAIAGGNGSNPIDSATGNKFQREIDYTGSGSFPLHLERTYNSARTLFDNMPVPVGVGWTHNYMARLQAVGDGVVINRIRAYRPNGAIQTFACTGGTCTGDPDLPERLVAVISGNTLLSARYTRADETVETYDGEGKLIAITRRDGATQTLSYATATGTSPYVQAVTDPEGRSLVFTYEDNRLATVSDPAGHVIRYAHLDDDLVSVTYASGEPAQATRIYHYNEAGQTDGLSMPHLLTGITDESGQRYASWGYDRRRRGVLSVHGDYTSGTIDRTALAFNSDGTSTITDSLGRTRTYSFAVQYHVARFAGLNAACPGCANTTRQRTYDGNGMPDVSTDFAGNQTDQDFNARLLETRRIEAANSPQARRTVETDWHPSLRLPTQRRTLDASNTRIAQTDWTYNSRGQPLTTTQTDPATGATRITTSTWCEQADVDAGLCPRVGLLLAVDGPRSDVVDTTTYSYYPSDDASCVTAPTTCPHRRGDLWRVTNALGQVTETLSYDGAGRPLAVKDANGVITDLRYDARGHLILRKVRGGADAEDRSTRIAYWPTGQVKKVTQPDGSYTLFRYDAAQRLTGIDDSAGNRIRYTLDNAGHRIKEDTRDPSGALTRQLSRVHDDLGRLQSQSDAYGHASGFTYDANGNTTSTTDALGRQTNNAYDPLNRLVATLQDSGGVAASTQFQYDANDNLTRVTDPNGLHTDYSYNALGDLLQLQSPDTGSTQYGYDSAGNRSSQTDARGKTQTYSYDALNRLIQITGPTRKYFYDSANASVCPAGERSNKGRLSGFNDPSGNTRYCHNRFGDLTRKVQTTNGMTFVTAYGYDSAGRLATTTYPDGAVLDAVYDANGQVLELGITPSGGTRQTVIAGITYAPFGPATGWQYGNGRILLRNLNRNYQPDAIWDADAGGLSLRYGFDAVGNLTTLQQADQTTMLAQYGYDGLNRLTQVMDGPTGTPIETYTYDATGNRTALINAGNTTAYSYPIDSHRLASVGGQNRTYDAGGNALTIGGNGRRFVYDNSGRMTQAKAGNTVLRQYQYNAKGEQTRTYLDADSAYFVHDEAGHLLGEYDSNGSPTQQILWFGDLPVGILQGAGTAQQLHYIEPDHLGTPRVIIDGQRNVAIWEWGLIGEAFGASPPNQDPDRDGVQFTFNLRFTGQRYDAATGLNYNYFRDYDPGAGRYIESDPIGLSGGMSTYAYVGGNPLLFTDPLGLAPGDTFATPEDAAIDMFNWIVSQTRLNRRWDPRNEVGGWIIRKGKCFTYRDEFGSGGGFSTGMPPRPHDAVAAFHTHTMTPFRDIRQVNFSRPGDVAGNPQAGDLSSANQNYYGLQFVGGFMHGGVDPATRRVILVPRMFRNEPPSRNGAPVRMRAPEGCECNP